MTNTKEKIPACPAAGKCGGCAYQGIPYEEQLQKKKEQVRRLLRDICPVRAAVGMEDPYHYRNKVHAAFGRLRRRPDRSPAFTRRAPTKSCGGQLPDRRSDGGLHHPGHPGAAASFKIKIYNEDSGYGLLRHVLIRRGFATGQVLVALVLASPILPSKNNFVKALRKLHPEITTVVLNVNDKKTSMVLGERNITLYGKGYIEDILCGKTYRISPGSFYQVNPVQTEVLYRKAIELAGLTGRERVLDAYCGIGTIGMTAADQAGEVIGVELNRAAVRGRHQQRQGQRGEEHPLLCRGRGRLSGRPGGPGRNRGCGLSGSAPGGQHGKISERRGPDGSGAGGIRVLQPGNIGQRPEISEEKRVPGGRGLDGGYVSLDREL